MRCAFFHILAVVLAISCGDAGDKAISYSLAEDVVLSARDSTYILKEGGMHLQLTISAEMMAQGTPLIRFNSASGVYLFKDATDRISMEISNDNRSWTDIIAQIDQNALFKIEWIDTTSHFAVYNRMLPDGSRYDQMLVCMLESDTQRILVSPSPEGQYSEDDVQKMKRILSTIKLLL